MRWLAQIEGGVADRDRAADPGGLTNLGVTQKTLDEYRSIYPDDRDMPASVRELRPDQSQRVYRRMYWNAVSGDQLPPYLALLAFDAAVHSGPTRAVKWLQEAVGTNPDGIIGPRTLTAAMGADPRLAILRMAGDRLWFLRGLSNAAANPGWFRARLPLLIITATRWADAGEVV